MEDKILSPKEKALELFETYFYDVHSITKYEAKQCALITVDEIIKNRPTEPDDGYWEVLSDKVETCIEYWNKVISEIAKL